MKNSLLPPILEVADKNGLKINERTRKRKEVACKCPYCYQDQAKEKYYLSLNTDYNVFKCWRCKASGGVLKLMAYLEDCSEKELIQNIRKQGGYQYRKHPAEQLTSDQLRAIGYPHVNWIESRKYDDQLYKAFRAHVITKWRAYVEGKKMDAYRALFLGLITNSFQAGVNKVREIEKHTNEKMLDDLLKELSKEQKSDEFADIEIRTIELLNLKHPMEKLLKIKP